jgi:GTP-binding protein Era
MQAYGALGDWKAVVPFSARDGENVDRLVAALAAELPEGDAPLFPEDVLTDQAERVLAAEYVREEIMERTRDEIPYAVAVEVEEFDESERRDGGGLVRIGAVVLVERPSQKAILVGRGGAMLKAVGTGAREKLERLLGAKVFLRLLVKVEPRWSERAETLRRLGIGA